MAIYSPYVPWFFTMGVPTFGNLRIEAYLQLPAAFRSLSRPSSAPNAKAFSICSSSLELPLCLIHRIKHNCSRYRLNCCVSYFAVTWSSFLSSAPGKIVSFYPFSLTKKPDFDFIDFFVFSLYFVCHVCHTNSFKN